MPVEFDDLGLSIFGNEIRALRFFDDTRQLRAAIYLDRNNRLNVGDLSISTEISGGSASDYAPVDMSGVPFLTLAESSLLAAERVMTPGDGLAGNDAGAGGAYTLAVDGTVVRTSRLISSGSGLTGGGSLAADRTLAVVPGAGIAVSGSVSVVPGNGISVSGSVSVVAGDGLTAGSAVAVDGTVVRTSRTLTAGTLIGGGGDLSADRTLDVELHHIVRLSAGTTTEYAATAAGLTAALAATASGDAVILPACDLTETSWTVPAGVTLRGQDILSSKLRGLVVVYGTLESVSVYGSAAGDVVRADVGRVLRVYVEGSGSAQTGIRLIGGSYAVDCYVTYSGTPTFYALRCTGAAQIYGCYLAGYTGGADATAGRFFNCFFAGAVDYGLYASGGAIAVYGGMATGGAYDVKITGTCNLSGLQYTTISGTPVYLPGDRAAYDVESYHAGDIEAGALTRHLPAPSVAGKIVIDSGSVWAAQLMSGDATLSSLGALTIASSAVTLPKMAALAGLSVIGNSGSASATPQALTAGSVGQVLRRASSGSSLEFGAVDLGNANAVTGVLPVANGGTGGSAATAITALTGDVTATGPGSVAATIAAGAVTSAKLAVGAINLTSGSALTGILPASLGGTGAASLSAASIPTGTGTSGYTARWTGANTIGNGALRDNGSTAGVGGAATNAALYVGPTLTGTNQYGILGQPTFSSATYASGIYGSPVIQAGAIVTNVYGLYSAGPSIGSGGSIGTQYGVFVANQNPAGVTSSWGIWQNGGSDRNYLAGNTLLGASTIAPASGSALLAIARSTASPTGGAADSALIFVKRLTSGSGTAVNTDAAICVQSAGSTYEYELGRHAKLPGGQQVAVRTVSANYTAQDSDYVLLCTGGSAGITVTLPAAANVSSFVAGVGTAMKLHVEKADVGAGVITVSGSAGELINGSTTKRLEAQYEALTIVCNGTGWTIL